MGLVRSYRAAVAAAFLGVVVAGAVGRFSPARAQAATRPQHAATRDSAVEVSAIRSGTLRHFPMAALAAGADTARRMDLALMLWLIREPEAGGRWRNVLVDAGFYRDAFVRRWQPADYQRPSVALAVVGVRPEDVTDLIVSHVHWDHLDGTDLFPNARVWTQRAEYAHHVDPAAHALDRAIDTADASMLARLRAAGRVTLVDGDSTHVLPGVTVYAGGRHTFASQYVGVARIE